MPRKKRPLSREGGVVRDASLFVIASEDKFAVKEYFSRFKTKKVYIAVIPTEDTKSAPEYVLDRIDDFIRDYVTEATDSFWLCIDRDRWQETTLVAINRLCVQKGYHFILSDPCFELWVLLHFEAVSPLPKQACSEVSERLRSILGGYSKKCCRTLAMTEETVQSAIDRARAMDAHGDNPSPPAMLTKVYKILDAMIGADKIIQVS